MNQHSDTSVPDLHALSVFLRAYWARRGAFEGSKTRGGDMRRPTVMHLQRSVDPPDLFQQIFYLFHIYTQPFLQWTNITMLTNFKHRITLQVYTLIIFTWYKIFGRSILNYNAIHLHHLNNLSAFLSFCLQLEILSLERCTPLPRSGIHISCVAIWLRKRKVR